MHWLVDGYNLIRRNHELADVEARDGLAAGRQALCNRLANAARRSRDRFTVVFDGTRGGGQVQGGGGVSVVFSSAQKTADTVLIERAGPEVTVVSDDRDVVHGAQRAGARTISVAALDEDPRRRTQAVKPQPPSRSPSSAGSWRAVRIRGVGGGGGN